MTLSNSDVIVQTFQKAKCKWSETRKYKAVENLKEYRLLYIFFHD